MRDGLGEPLVHLRPDNLEAIRAFLDGQSRVKAAAWARHEEPGPNGPQAPDHHILLAVDDLDWETGDIRALDEAIALPYLDIGGPTWRDFFPLSELPDVRRFATMLWEQTTPGDDPLDYRLTWEPLEVEAATAAKFAELLRPKPEIRRVEATRERLWNGQNEERSSVGLYVDAEPTVRGALESARRAARDAGVLVTPNHSATLGLPRDERVHTATLYEAAA
jgi:hypothetical protein